MDITGLTIDSSVSSLTSPEKINTYSGTEDAAKKKFAMDFESIFIDKLLGEMKNTIGEWGEEKDGAAQQTEGLFYMFLAKGLGENGGLGLWKDIYKSLQNGTEQNNTNTILDKKI
jgi:Rod binding domain-containing protein